MDHTPCKSSPVDRMLAHLAIEFRCRRASRVAAATVRSSRAQHASSQSIGRNDQRCPRGDLLIGVPQAHFALLRCKSTEARPCARQEGGPCAYCFGNKGRVERAAGQCRASGQRDLRGSAARCQPNALERHRSAAVDDVREPRRLQRCERRAARGSSRRPWLAETSPDPPAARRSPGMRSAVRPMLPPGRPRRRSPARCAAWLPPMSASVESRPPPRQQPTARPAADHGRAVQPGSVGQRSRLRDCERTLNGTRPIDVDHVGARQQSGYNVAPRRNRPNCDSNH